MRRRRGRGTRFGPRLTPRELDERLGPLPPVSLLETVRALAFHEEPLPEAAARVLLREALRLSGGNAELAAEILGISSRGINYRLACYGARPVDLARVDERREEGRECGSIVPGAAGGCSSGESTGSPSGTSRSSSAPEGSGSGAGIGR